jgi:limonene-1,2-epoxide hydrolase
MRPWSCFRISVTSTARRGLVQFDLAEFFTLRTGRIIQHRSFFDSFDLIQQLLGRDLTDAFGTIVQGAMRT